MYLETMVQAGVDLAACIFFSAVASPTLRHIDSFFSFCLVVTSTT
jgi:hypothetical protein